MSMRLFGFRLSSMYGPVPADLLANQFLDQGSELVLLLLIALGLAIKNHGTVPGNSEYGAESLITNVFASGASKPAMLIRYDAGPWLISRRRLKLVSTACESSLAPSWNTMPWRSLNVY